MKALIFHRDGFFFYELELRGFWYRKIYPYCHISKYPSFWRGMYSVCEQNVMIFEARKMEWRMDFFC